MICMYAVQRHEQKVLQVIFNPECMLGDVMQLIPMFSLIQVMDWIENHGEAFLSKHTGVGKSLHRARALQKRHDDFEDVAQVSLSVQSKLLACCCDLSRVYPASRPMSAGIGL